MADLDEQLRVITVKMETVEVSFYTEIAYFRENEKQLQEEKIRLREKLILMRRHKYKIQ